jgi:hypothetical protein
MLRERPPKPPPAMMPVITAGPSKQKQFFRVEYRVVRLASGTRRTARVIMSTRDKPARERRKQTERE